MIRFAPFLLIAFIAFLIWLAWAMDTRKKRMRVQVREQRDQLTRQMELLRSITLIAANSSDVDPSAGLILIEIERFKKKEQELT